MKVLTFSLIMILAPFMLYAGKIDKNQVPIRRPDFCGVWGIWGGENVSAKGRSWFKGVVATTDWDIIEPQNGRFEWENFDKKVRQITDKGLNVMLMVYHGEKCPGWVYEAGVPKVLNISFGSAVRVEKESKVIEPYYLDPKYKPLLSRMINETAKHISNYPPEIRRYIIGVQCPTGKSGDPQPYHAEPVEKKYAIGLNSPEWIDWTIDMIKVYKDAYKDFKPPFFMLFKGPNPATNDWLLKNIPDSWRKPHSIAQGYQFNGEIKIMNDLYPLTCRFIDGVVVRTRGELDNTQYSRTGWFTAAPVWNVYWSGLWNLTYGLDIWCQLPGVLEDARHVPAFTFYSGYAGYKDATDSPGAWIALRDGLDCMDTLRFPEDRFGPVGPHKDGRTSENKDRYRRIAEAFAVYGAALDDPDNVALGDLQVRRQSGINDVYGYIWPGNYSMFLEQIEPNETSQGYWRVGSKEQPYGRFARGFDVKNGKTEMFFNLDDRFFASKSLPPHSVKVRVVYFDKGKGSWSLKYDAIDNPQKVATTVTNTNTNQWKEITVTLDDARLENHGPKKTDLSLVHKGGDETIFHMVELERR
ncbi:MAG: beta-galactosidase [Bacteroidia bacterium]|nr:beta-galactosidase [Bacteroidia bacterium]